MKRSPEPAKTFTQSMAELESIVARLEGGELELEEALAAFESGVGLVRALTQRLNEAQARVEVLTRNPDGTPLLQPMATDDVAKE